MRLPAALNRSNKKGQVTYLTIATCPYFYVMLFFCLFDDQIP